MQEQGHRQGLEEGQSRWETPSDVGVGVGKGSKKKRWRSKSRKEPVELPADEVQRRKSEKRVSELDTPTGLGIQKDTAEKHQEGGKA